MNPQFVNFQRYECAPLCQLLCCITVLFKILYCKIKTVFFIYCICLFCVSFYPALFLPSLILIDILYDSILVFY